MSENYYYTTTVIQAKFETPAQLETDNYILQAWSTFTDNNHNKNATPYALALSHYTSHYP